MRGIRFEATFGEETKVVEISFAPGSARQWHLLINNRFQGQFIKQNGIRTFKYQNAPDWSSGDDIGILVDIFFEISGEQR